MLINKIFLILNIKLANLAVFLLSFINKIIAFRTYNKPILFINLVTILKIINSSLNSNLFSYKLVNIIKL